MIKLIIVLLAILGAIFVVMPFFNRAVFDFQCETSGCSGQICEARKIIGSSIGSCDYRPEYQCLRGCGVRSYRCGFDSDFEKKCVDCIKACNGNEDLEKCYDGCYAKYNETA